VTHPNMDKNNKKAIIIGCGIAGPVLALALNRAGIKSEIFESQKTFDEDSGLFHYLSPNGMNVFNILGIYDKIKNIGHVCNEIIHYKENGKQMASIDEKNEKEEFGARSIMIKRALLIKALCKEVISKGIGLHLGKKLKNIENMDDGKVIAHFEDGTNAKGDFIVGCDGIHSRTREIIMPDAPKPTYTKVVVTGGYTNIPIKNKSHNTIHSNYCKNAFFAYFILPNGEIWWWNGMSYPQEQTKEELERIPDDQWQQTLNDLYREDPLIIRDIAGSTHEKFLKYPIYDVLDLKTWHNSNVCLIGDAAHATSPHAGQGATMAMEDAVTLAKCLRDIENTKDAFAKFENLRKDRAERIVKLGRTAGEGYFASTSMKKWFRNTMITITMTPFIFKRMQKFLFGYDVEWDKKLKSAPKSS
jgi:2-polyprenyl-6-methoxyphenol hydroxylase-like FAD-dependent oxidoreductase